MALPPDVETTVVTGTWLDLEGDPCTGTVTFDPEPCVITFADDRTFVLGRTTALLGTDGTISVALVASDATGANPQGFTYTVTERISCAECTRTYSILVPADAGTMDLSGVAPVDPDQGDYIPVPGPQGAQGDPGHTPVLYSGTTAPTDVEGAVDGDLYLDQSSGDLYTMQDGVWVDAGNLTGPAGPQGEQGEQGEAGPTGDTGPAGPTGDTGATGATGATGPAGPAGTDGTDGTDGADGHTPEPYTGTGDPATDLGQDGDLYLDSTSGELWGNQDGTWTKLGDLTGPAGPQGEQGEQGNPGTIDATLVAGDGIEFSGTGTTEDPYSVGIDLSADDGNMAVFGSDNGLYVPTAETATVTAGDGITVTGTAPDYTVSALVSGDSANMLSLGTDNGLYAAGTVVRAYDPAIVVTGNRTAGYVVRSDLYYASCFQVRTLDGSTGAIPTTWTNTTTGVWPNIGFFSPYTGNCWVNISARIANYNTSSSSIYAGFEFINSTSGVTTAANTGRAVGVNGGGVTASNAVAIAVSKGDAVIINPAYYASSYSTTSGQTFITGGAIRVWIQPT